MAVLKRIGVLSVAKIYAIIMAIFGLIAGIFYAISGAIIGSVMGAGGMIGNAVMDSNIPSNMFIGLGFLGIIILPIAYGIIGFVTGAIGAFLYNVIAKWVGGVEIEFEE